MTTQREATKYKTQDVKKFLLEDQFDKNLIKIKERTSHNFMSDKFGRRVAAHIQVLRDEGYLIRTVDGTGIDIFTGVKDYNLISPFPGKPRDPARQKIEDSRDLLKSFINDNKVDWRKPPTNAQLESLVDDIFKISRARNSSTYNEYTEKVLIIQRKIWESLTASFRTPIYVGYKDKEWEVCYLYGKNRMVNKIKNRDLKQWLKNL